MGRLHGNRQYGFGASGSGGVHHQLFESLLAPALRQGYMRMIIIFGKLGAIAGLQARKSRNPS